MKYHALVFTNTTDNFRRTSSTVLHLTRGEVLEQRQLTVCSTEKKMTDINNMNPLSYSSNWFSMSSL
jgi:hypothetical protein